MPQPYSSTRQCIIEIASIDVEEHVQGTLSRHNSCCRCTAFCKVTSLYLAGHCTLIAQAIDLQAGAMSAVRV